MQIIFTGQVDNLTMLVVMKIVFIIGLQIIDGMIYHVLALLLILHVQTIIIYMDQIHGFMVYIHMKFSIIT